MRIRLSDDRRARVLRRPEASLRSANSTIRSATSAPTGCSISSCASWARRSTTRASAMPAATCRKSWPTSTARSTSPSPSRRHASRARIRRHPGGPHEGARSGSRRHRHRWPAAARSALAHHSFAAEYDDQKPLKITGTLTKVEWMNPHIWYYVDVKNPDGSVTTWAISGGAPGQLMRRGITKDLLVVGSDGERRRLPAPRTAPTTASASASPIRTAATCSRPPTRRAARRRNSARRIR